MSTVFLLDFKSSGNNHIIFITLSGIVFSLRLIVNVEFSPLCIKITPSSSKDVRNSILPLPLTSLVSSVPSHENSSSGIRVLTTSIFSSKVPKLPFRLSATYQQIHSYLSLKVWIKKDLTLSKKCFYILSLWRSQSIYLATSKLKRTGIKTHHL